MDVLNAFFYVVPGIIMAGALFMAYRIVRRTVQMRMAWNSGLTAEAHFLRPFTSVHGGSGDSSVRSTLHHVYQFTSRHGRRVRFEEENGPAAIVEGDIVTVYYKEGREVIATAHAPRRARQTAATVGLLAFLGAVVGFCVVFVITYTEVFLASDIDGF